MSDEDYDACEKLFCGSWKVSKDENLEAYMAASGMNEQMKAFVRQEKEFTLTRVGNKFVDKAVVGGVDIEIQLAFNEEIEWKDKEENPIFHVKMIARFKDGVWSQTTTPLNVDGGKVQVMKSHIDGDELVAELSLPDVPGVKAKRTFKKV